MAVPATFENTLRVHDEAVKKWLDGLLMSYSIKQPDGDIVQLTNQPIFSVIASPTRMGEEVYKLLTQEGLVPTIAEGKKFPVPPLPIAGIQRALPQRDPEWTSLAFTFATHFDDVTGKYIKYQWPTHYRTEYTITFLSKTKRVMNYIVEWIESQFGVLGAAQGERFLDVEHAQPWGTANQSFKLVGSTDLSEFEGDDQVFQRTQFMFSLRTWLIRPSIGSAEVVDVVEPGLITDPAGNVVDQESAVLSGNLFAPPYRLLPSQYATRWPDQGTATIKPGVQLTTLYIRQPDLANYFTVTVGATEDDDAVRLLERPYGSVTPALFSVELDYSSNAAVKLVCKQRDVNGTDAETDDVINPAYELALPATTSFPGLLFHLHRFVYITDQTIQLWLASAGTVANTVLKSIKVQRLLGVIDTAPTTSGSSGGFNFWEWTGLSNSQPYLIHASVTDTASADVTATVQDSATSPTNTRSEIINDTKQDGFVLLTQPKDGTLRLEVPDTVTLANVQARKYDGHYAGNEV